VASVLDRAYTAYQQAIIDVVLATTFRVEERDYYGGTRGSGCQCPVALAIKRQLGTSAIVSICAATVRIDNVWFMTPKEVDAYIKAYDRRDPFCFTLDFQLKELA